MIREDGKERRIALEYRQICMCLFNIVALVHSKSLSINRILLLWNKFNLSIWLVSVSSKDSKPDFSTTLLGSPGHWDITETMELIMTSYMYNSEVIYSAGRAYCQLSYQQMWSVSARSDRGAEIHGKTLVNAEFVTGPQIPADPTLTGLQASSFKAKMGKWWSLCYLNWK